MDIGWISSLSTDQSQIKLKKQWKQYVYHGICGDAIRKEVLQAWERCTQLGTNPYQSTPVYLTDEDEIQERLQKNAALLSVSVPAIQNLYDFNAGHSQLFVSVSDAKGCLLMVRNADKNINSKNSLLYTLWDEHSMGNNPIGTSIAEKKPVIVIGYEHYCMYPHHHAGAGAPIFNPQGKLVGAISVTVAATNAHQHTLGMAVMTAYAIERELKILKSMQDIDLAYQHRNAVINSISEGLLIVSGDYHITYVNKIFADIFEFDNIDMLVGQHLFQYFQDKLFCKALSSGEEITDFITEISFGTRRVPCTVTYRRLILKHANEGVIIVNKLARAQKLAQRLKKGQAFATFQDIIGDSPEFKEVVNVAKSFAETDSNILLLGESGTGKEVFAQAIHNHSERKYDPFIPVNCGALPKDLIASEFFGYVEGAFTGAKRGGSVGKFEQANKGTIFLDEIAELPYELQATLLRALETRVICKVGGAEYIPIDVRVIAATNKNLQEEIKKQTFREDLYYRLNILSLSLPPLRQHPNDIILLVQHFLQDMNQRYGKHIEGIDVEALDYLSRYSWPGNIRELRNIIERCVALTNETYITPKLLPQELLGTGDFSPLVSRKKITPTIPQNMFTCACTQEDILAALNNSHWNVSHAAQSLGVSRSTLYRYMKHFQIDR